MKGFWGGDGGGAWVKEVVIGPKAKCLGSFLRASGGTTGGDMPNVVVISPKMNDGEGIGADAEIGGSLPLDAIESTIVVGAGRLIAGGSRVGGCDEDGASPPSTFLILLLSLLFWLLPFFSSSSFGASRCCSTGPANSASGRKSFEAHGKSM